MRSRKESFILYLLLALNPLCSLMSLLMDQKARQNKTKPKPISVRGTEQQIQLLNSGKAIS